MTNSTVLERRGSQYQLHKARERTSLRRLFRSPRAGIFAEYPGKIALRSKASRDYGINLFITMIPGLSDNVEHLQKFDHPTRAFVVSLDTSSQTIVYSYTKSIVKSNICTPK